MNLLRRRRIRRQLDLVRLYTLRLGEPVEVVSGPQPTSALTGSPGRHAESVVCPVCHATPGRPCIRPLVKADRRGQSHRERWAVFYARAAA